ncbi:MAG: integrin alpha [Pseudomonadota bacterium]
MQSTLALIAVTAQAAGGFPPVVDLEDFDGNDGMVVDGRSADDLLGTGVRIVGDVNGDGMDDIGIGALLAATEQLPLGGEAYIIFGGDALPESLSVDDLNGVNGFVFQGTSPDSGIFVVSGIGDLNADGLDDIMITASSVQIDGEASVGRVYIVFGRAEPFDPPVITEADLDGSVGVAIDGWDDFGDFGDCAAPAGDFNNDGYDDALVVARTADAGGRRVSGQAYVLFGGPNFVETVPDNIISLDGTNGVVFNGAANGNTTGRDCGGAFDANADGVSDIILGANSARGAANESGGEVYILFGRSGPFPARVDLSGLEAGSGITIKCVEDAIRCGIASVGVGDLNEDGVDDVAFGSAVANLQAGQVWVVFGSPALDDQAELLSTDLDGSNGFTIIGAQEGAADSDLVLGWVDDLNDDGVNDLLISGREGSAPGRPGAGLVYAVLGGAGLGATGHMELSDAAAIRFLGPDPEASLGDSVSTTSGDVNGDGRPDFVLGAPFALVDGVSTGRAYVFFGRADLDGDDVPDSEDNCVEDFNQDQRDTNKDGFGNVCDADLDNNCVVDLRDWVVMRSVFGSNDADADLDGNGTVDIADARTLFRDRFEAPGPSGEIEACAPN